MSRKTFVMTHPSKTQHSPEKTSKAQQYHGGGGGGAPISRIILKRLPDPAKTLPNPPQNPPQGLSKPLQNRSKIQFFIEIAYGTYFSQFLDPPRPPKPSQNPPKSSKNRSKNEVEKNIHFRNNLLTIFLDFGPQKPSIFRWFFGAFSHQTRKTQFCKNWALASTGARFLRVRASKKQLKNTKKTIQNEASKRTPSKTRKHSIFGAMLASQTPPKPLHNGRKNLSKTMSKKDSKKRASKSQ